MFSRTINFQRYVFQTTREINMPMESSNIEDIVSFLKMFFYFDCEEKLKEILNRENRTYYSTKKVHISIRPSNYENPKLSYGKEKPIVTDIRTEVWDRDEDDGYWLVLKFDY